MQFKAQTITFAEMKRQRIGKVTRRDNPFGARCQLEELRQDIETCSPELRERIKVAAARLRPSVHDVASAVAYQLVYFELRVKIEKAQRAKDNKKK